MLRGGFFQSLDAILLMRGWWSTQTNRRGGHLHQRDVYENSSAEDIEKLVTIPLEDKISTIPGIKNIKSIELDKIKVKGKDELVTIYKPVI